MLYYLSAEIKNFDVKVKVMDAALTIIFVTIFFLILRIRSKKKLVNKFNSGKYGFNLYFYFLVSTVVLISVLPTLLFYFSYNKKNTRFFKM
ncbi:hypothetical protein DCC35_10630 [Mangrovivirga cuniculi]|uniref:Uncharacterized protein n=1 Tax=Mangrovivirga cuniculi TaxID=2715131 RepID=A0A4D7JG75_9BACT|nr:hypothetical protein DCC35_10630 [Mangrovivirga cuniculi]